MPTYEFLSQKCFACVRNCGIRCNIHLASSLTSDACCLTPLTFALGLPTVHRDIDQLSRGIVNPHFGETTVPRLFRRIALGTRGTCSL
jgi:hypothetical protein